MANGLPPGHLVAGLEFIEARKASLASGKRSEQIEAPYECSAAAAERCRPAGAA